MLGSALSPTHFHWAASIVANGPTCASEGASKESARTHWNTPEHARSGYAQHRTALATPPQPGAGHPAQPGWGRSLNQCAEHGKQSSWSGRRVNRCAWASKQSSCCAGQAFLLELVSGSSNKRIQCACRAVASSERVPRAKDSTGRNEVRELAGCHLENVEQSQFWSNSPTATENTVTGWAWAHIFSRQFPNRAWGAEGRLSFSRALRRGRGWRRQIGHEAVLSLQNLRKNWFCWNQCQITGDACIPAQGSFPFPAILFPFCRDVCTQSRMWLSPWLLWLMKINCKIFPLLHAFVSIYFQDKSIGSGLRFGHPTQLLESCLFLQWKGNKEIHTGHCVSASKTWQDNEQQKRQNNRNKTSCREGAYIFFFISRFKSEANLWCWLRTGAFWTVSVATMHNR